MIFILHFLQTASPSIVGISSKLPVKTEIRNETYAPAMYATVKRNSVKPSSDEKSHRVSVIGIEGPDLKVGEVVISVSFNGETSFLLFVAKSNTS